MKNVVHLIDCMEFMKTVPDKYYELTIVDPPYGIGANKMTLGNGVNKIYRGREDWDTLPPDEKYFTELFRISQNQIIWGANNFCSYLPNSTGWIFWDKGTGLNDYSDGELAYTSFKKVLKKYFQSWVGANAKDYGNRIHPTQKPVALYKWLLQNYAKPHDKIFDSHVGSGSSRIACHDLGFDFEGCELDPDYCQGQEDRYKTHINQQSLFDTKEIQGLIYENN